MIDAFNHDMPFDEFLVEQLAGDLLLQTEHQALNNRRLIATSFLALGIKIDAEQDPEKKTRPTLSMNNSIRWAGLFWA